MIALEILAQLVCKLDYSLVSIVGPKVEILRHMWLNSMRIIVASRNRKTPYEINSSYIFRSLYGIGYIHVSYYLSIIYGMVYIPHKNIKGLKLHSL